MLGQAMKVKFKTSVSSVILISNKTLIREIEDDSTSLREMPLRNLNNPPTHTSSLDDTEQKFDAENAIEAIREKPATDHNHNGVAVKKRKVTFADETVVKEVVKPWNLRNKRRKPMKLGESDEENSDEVKMPKMQNRDDTEQKFDAENALEAIREKPTTDDKHHGVAAKKRKVTFADETAAKEVVKPWNLRNKRRKPMKLGESDEENSDEVKMPKMQNRDDTEQKFDAENAIEAIREKPATDHNHNGVAVKKRKVTFADETVVKEVVKPWNLRNKRRKPMKLGESDEENSDEVKDLMKADFSLCLSKEEIKEDLLRLQEKGDSKKPSRKPKKRPAKVQKAIDRLFPGFEITEIIDGAIRRECQRRQADQIKKFYPRSKKFREM